VIAQPGGRETLLREMVSFELLLREAKRRGYDRHPFVTGAVRKAVAIELEEGPLAVDPASISDEDVREAYEAASVRFNRPLMRRASHIQVRTEAEARALITELKNADRAHFSRVARQRSENPQTARQAGELGYFTEAGLDTSNKPVKGLAKELLEASFASEPNRVHPEPIAHDGVFSVLMVTGVQAAFVTPLARVEPIVREEVAEARSVAARDALLQKLRGTLKPVVHTELLDLVVLDPTPLDIPRGFPAAPTDPTVPTPVVIPDGY